MPFDRRAHRPLGYFWPARYSQVHPQLKLLPEAGLLSVTATAGPGPHDKLIYSVTGAGRAALGEWVAEPPRNLPVRDELLLKVFAMWAADREAIRAMIAGQADAYRAELAEYQAIFDEVTNGDPDAVPPFESPRFGEFATLRYGLGWARLRMEWCGWLLAAIDEAAPN